MFFVQIQCADKRRPQFGQEVKRTAQEGDMTADRLAAGKSGDGLIDNRLENGGGQIFSCGAFINQRLNIGFCKNTAPGRDGIQRLIMLCKFIQSRRVALQKRCHLVDEGTGASRADAVHALFDIAVFKIDNLGVLAAQLDGHIRLRRKALQSGRDCDHLLDEGDFQIVCKCETARTGNHRVNSDVSDLTLRLLHQIRECAADVGVMAPVIGKSQFVIRVQDSYFDSGGTDVDSEGIVFSDQI